MQANVLDEAELWQVLDFLTFIKKWNFTESLPNLALSLKFFLTVCVSVASCECRAKLFKVETDQALSTINKIGLGQSRLSYPIAFEH